MQLKLKKRLNEIKKNKKIIFSLAMIFALSSFKSEKKELITQTNKVEVTSVQNDDEEGRCTYTLSFTNYETGETKTETYGECFFYY